MTRISTPAAPDVHSGTCDCAACEPYVATHSTGVTEAELIAIMTIAGIFVGIVLCWILDRLIDGPGISIMWGV